MDYGTTGEELVKRIRALIPANPQIKDMTDPFALFKVPGFDCSDLDVTYAMAGAALAKAQQEESNV